MQYKELAEVYDSLEKTSKRLEKTAIIAKLLKKSLLGELGMIVLLIQGRIYHPWENKKTGVASKLVAKAISVSTGISQKKVIAWWKEMGDLGDVAQRAVRLKKQATLFSKQLPVQKVFSVFQNLAGFEGSGAVERKIQSVGELLANASYLEAKYIARTLQETLRVGIGEAVMRDAIVWAFLMDVSYDQEHNGLGLDGDARSRYSAITGAVQRAYDLCNDFGKVARIAKKHGLKGIQELSLELGKPMNFMLFLRAENIEEAFEMIGKPAAFEYKYDGFRLQIHKWEKVHLFTRRMEDVTRQFPELVRAVEEKVGGTCILDAEAVGYELGTGMYLPFQKISQRIKRKYNIEKIAEKFPVELHVFDILYYDGKVLLDIPFKERRKLLERVLSPSDGAIRLAKQLITDDIQEAVSFYEESLRIGEEGIMGKNLEGLYQPGKRVGYGVKIKPRLEPLDLVIVQAEWGEGKRSGWLTSFTLACKKENDLLEIGKVSTGLKEKPEQGLSFKDMTDMLKPMILFSEGRKVKVKPEIVIEVGYDEIQKSPSYTSGYALRFPRVKRLRSMEKSVEDINSLEDVEELFKKQGGRGK